MTGMENVLAAHTLDVVIPDSWDETKTWTVFCDCGWMKPVPEHRPGEIAHAAHVAEALTAAGFGSLHDAWADTISRVEVIDYTGRAYTKYTPAGTVSIDRQDQGRTLKVFITEGATK